MGKLDIDLLITVPQIFLIYGCASFTHRNVASKLFLTGQTAERQDPQTFPLLDVYCTAVYSLQSIAVVEPGDIFSNPDSVSIGNTKTCSMLGTAHLRYFGEQVLYSMKFKIVSATLCAKGTRLHDIGPSSIIPGRRLQDKKYRLCKLSHCKSVTGH